MYQIGPVRSSRIPNDCTKSGTVKVLSHFGNKHHPNKGTGYTTQPLLLRLANWKGAFPRSPLARMAYARGLVEKEWCREQVRFEAQPGLNSVE